MAAKKNQPSKPFQLGTFFLITTIILGILTVVLYKRVEILKAEAHTYLVEEEKCQRELAKLSDCPKELDQTREYQGNMNTQLEQEKHNLQLRADSLQKVLTSVQVEAKKNKADSYNKPRSKSIDEPESYVVSNEVLKQYEKRYDQRVMTDVLRTNMNP